MTVLLPAFNAGEHLVAALRSITGQTYRELEILLIDDGSTDGSVDVALLAVPDERIRLLRHPNIGLAPSLNRGLSEAHGDYIARMDADDVSRPDRIERQLAVLTARPDVVLVGGQLARRVGDSTSAGDTAFPLQHEAILAGLRTTEHVLSHPAVLFRTAAARAVGGYWEHGPAEDWDLFLRLGAVGRLANVPEVVLEYRFHESGINASSMTTVRRNMRLAVENDRRRRRGRPLLAPEDLLSRRRPVLRASVRLQVLSLTAYRRSLLAAAAGRRGTALIGLAVSALLWPRQALRRARRRVAARRPVVVEGVPA